MNSIVVEILSWNRREVVECEFKGIVGNLGLCGFGIKFDW